MSNRVFEWLPYTMRPGGHNMDRMHNRVAGDGLPPGPHTSVHAAPHTAVQRSGASWAQSAFMLNSPCSASHALVSPTPLAMGLAIRRRPLHGRSPERQLPSPSTWRLKITVGILPFWKKFVLVQGTCTPQNHAHAGRTQLREPKRRFRQNLNSTRNFTARLRWPLGNRGRRI
jgi:hypothetical protein